MFEWKTDSYWIGPDYKTEPFSLESVCVECSQKIPEGKLFCEGDCKKRASAVRYLRASAIEFEEHLAYQWRRINPYVCTPEMMEKHAYMDIQVQSAFHHPLRTSSKLFHEAISWLDSETIAIMDEHDLDDYNQVIWHEVEGSQKIQHEPNWDWRSVKKARKLHCSKKD
jgi:hypothetical protein